MNERTITVKGIGNVKTKPDLVVITLELVTQMPDYAKTMEVAALELESIRKTLVSAGYEAQNLKTTSFNINTENESYKDAEGNWRREFIGYSCRHNLKLEFDFDMKRLGETMAAISESRVNPEFQIAFSVKDKNAVQSELLENAVANAAEKAAILAKTGRITLGPIKHIDYSWGEVRLYSETRFDNVMCAASTGAPEIDIEPEDVSANDTVTIIWEIL